MKYIPEIITADYTVITPKVYSNNITYREPQTVLLHSLGIGLLKECRPELL